MTHFTLNDRDFTAHSTRFGDSTIVLETKLSDDPFGHTYLAYYPTYTDEALYDIEDACQEQFLTAACITRAAAIILKPTISVKEAK